jgi:chromosome segregation ATPase
MTKAITLESLRKDIQHDIRSGIDDVLGAVKDLAQTTGGGFEGVNKRIDKLENRMDKSEKHAQSVDATLRDHTARFEQIDITLRDHTMRFAQIQLSLDEIIAKQDAHHNDIVEIYAILQKHEKHQKISDAELTDTKLRLQRLVRWAQATSKTLNIPIKL